MQSRLMSFAEAVTNVCVGYLIAVLAQLVIFPLFGIAATLGQHLAIGGMFTVVSIVRSYLLRRLFNAWGAARPAE